MSLLLSLCLFSLCISQTSALSTYGLTSDRFSHKFVIDLEPDKKWCIVESFEAGDDVQLSVQLLDPFDEPIRYYYLNVTSDVGGDVGEEYMQRNTVWVYYRVEKVSVRYLCKVSLQFTLVSNLVEQAGERVYCLRHTNSETKRVRFGIHSKPSKTEDMSDINAIADSDERTRRQLQVAHLHNLVTVVVYCRRVLAVCVAL